MASASHASSRGSDVRDRSSPSSPAENEEMGDQVKREFAAQAKSMSKSRKSKNKNFDNRDRAEEDLRLLSKRAGATFKNSKLDMFLARWGLIPAWIVLMCTLASSISFIPVIVVEWSPNFDTLGKWVWRGFVIAGFLNSLPFWIALSQWRPAEPLNGKPMGALPHVDILIPTYKEPTASIIETIVSCQRVEYSSNKMHCYILDDGQSNDLRQAVAALKKSGLLRFSLTYVRRPTNEGKKGGNLNYWLRTYEEVSGEFFLVLDADMQPFPDMLDTLMGHYYGLSEETRDRLSFIQAPQWYKNSYAEARWKDLFNVSEILFYRVLQPAMSYHGCALYVGCLALWNRRAIESIGGFIEGYSTEDSVTGCQLNRTRVPGRTDNWVSKFVTMPVASGETPDSLPSLFDQRMRWFYGLCQMFKHHNGYIFASGLTYYQKILFWITSASMVPNIINYTISFAGCMILFSAIAFYGFTSRFDNVTVWAFWVGGVSWVANFSLWALVPGVTFQQAAYSITTGFLYTPVLLASVLRYMFGLKFHVQDTVDQNDSEKIRRWHPLFLFPLGSMFLISCAAITSIVGVSMSRVIVPWPIICQIPLWWGMWIFLHQHTIAALIGYTYKFDKFYEEEFQGKRSNEIIQQKMHKHAEAIGEYQTSVRGKQTSSRRSDAASSYHSRKSDAPSSHRTGGSDESGSSDDLRAAGDWRDKYDDVESSDGSSLRTGDSASVSIPSKMISRLSVVLARRSAVSEAIADNPDRQPAKRNKTSNSISKTGFGFERNILGRVAHLLSLQAYLSGTGGVPSTSAVSNSEEISEGGRSDESRHAFPDRAVVGAQAAAEAAALEADTSVISGSGSSALSPSTYTGSSSEDSETTYSPGDSMTSASTMEEQTFATAHGSSLPTTSSK